ncbi:MAG TPA: UDP-N-acetylmuramoyl-L-alanine--D-glutamate ligase [Candidatus Saccharimonadales bacterium]|nr:UDP-N-acetylmuramoyl-L-alanine--D-glutamate ligase [Candidatus Saccharimonadales bacterium]
MRVYKEKLVAVIGAGVEGYSSATFLKNQGAFVTVLDQKTKDQLGSEVVEKFSSLGVKTNFGPDSLTDLSHFEILVRTAGIRPDVAQIDARVKQGATLTSNTKIFFDQTSAKIIGVTGTKGKGTTATLIYQILRTAGKNVFLAGNIGNPALDLLPQLTPESFVVLELSSFQLFDLDKSPHVAVVLMVVEEHLDWHKDIHEYKAAKFNLVAHQGAADFAVINIDYPHSREFLELGNSKKIQVSTKAELNTGIFVSNDSIYRRLGAAAERVVGLSEIGLLGKHNWENVASAVGAATALGIAINPINTAIKNFKGLEHRLEFVRELEGVKYYNDTFSTTPETAIAAIKSFTAPEIVILGGSDKGSNYEELGKEIVNAANVKTVVLIGQMAGKIKEAIEKAGQFKGEIKEGAKDMAEIVSQARESAKSGDIIVLSPACASFGMFKNYKDRGMQFKEIVNKL